MRKIDRSLLNLSGMKSRRRELRNNPTAAEAVLWKCLQHRKLLEMKFRRQYSIGRYVVDFFCVECNLAVELDGAVHNDVMRQEYDAERTVFLQNQGVELVRFENREVFENIEGVLERIREAIRKTLF
jgi:very-short-patch-repair endonuclease